MNDNPILLKDTLLSSRGLFLPLLISITNLVLLILLIGNLYYISLNGVQTGEIRYSAFLQSYYLVGAGLFLFLLLLAPAITVSSLSIEEQNMLELLLGTDLDSRSIILGKLYFFLLCRFLQRYIFTVGFRIFTCFYIFCHTSYPVFS